MHAGDLCEALGSCPSDVCHVQDRTKSAVSLDTCELPPEHRLVSREGVEILLNGCCGHHASRVANAMYAEIYRDSAAAAMGIPAWEDHERLRRMVASGAWEEPCPLEPREPLPPPFVPLETQTLNRAVCLREAGKGEYVSDAT